jgi:hypothetical protein
MKEQNTGEYDALVEEVERLRADEPKEEHGPEDMPMLMPCCQRGIYCRESDRDECEFPEDECLLLMRRAELERRIKEEEDA